MKAIALVSALLIGVSMAMPVLALTDDEMKTDWGQLGKYSAANSELKPVADNEKRVVFFGDSITEAYPLAKLFPGKSYINRGISGQTTPQMLVRFRQDVLNLQPSTVLIMAGTNDLARNTGVATLQQIEGNLVSMCELAKANNIQVILCSVLPAIKFDWRPGLTPSNDIQEMNKFLREYASAHHLGYVDYYAAVVDKDGGLRADLAKDAVHPSEAGYVAMAPLAEAAIQRTKIRKSHQRSGV